MTLCWGREGRSNVTDHGNAVSCVCVCVSWFNWLVVCVCVHFWVCVNVCVCIGYCVKRCVCMECFRPEKGWYAVLRQFTLHPLGGTVEQVLLETCCHLDPDWNRDNCSWQNKLLNLLFFPVFNGHGCFCCWNFSSNTTRGPGVFEQNEHQLVNMDPTHVSVDRVTLKFGRNTTLGWLV